MMTSPWRSAKCAGTSDHPAMPKTAGPAKSTMIAAIHIAHFASPSTYAAPNNRPTPIAVLTASPTTDRRRFASSRAAIRKSTIWPARTNAYATANGSARSPNASGTQSPATSRLAEAANIAIRTPPSSGSTTLVSHA